MKSNWKGFSNRKDIFMSELNKEVSNQMVSIHYKSILEKKLAWKLTMMDDKETFMIAKSVSKDYPYENRLDIPKWLFDKHPEQYNLFLTKELLQEYDFSFIFESPFKTIKMPYFVKDSIVLFFNEGEHNKHSFLIGYADQRFGEYQCVTFRWIKTLFELKSIFEAIKTYKLIKNENI